MIISSLRDAVPPSTRLTAVINSIYENSNTRDHHVIESLQELIIIRDVVKDMESALPKAVPKMFCETAGHSI